MCARLFVVDSESYQYTKDKLIVSVRLPRDKNSKAKKKPIGKPGEQWVKTVHDMMADMLQIKIGDYIFLWKIGEDEAKSCIYGVYRAISKPYYHLDNQNDEAPYKIHVEVAYDFAEPISEYDFLNCPYLHSSPWNVIGKKISGKGRASSPLSPAEENALVTMLIGLNPNYVFNPPNQSRVIPVEEPLRIDYTKAGENPMIKDYRDISPNEICPFDLKHKLYWEKTLEAIFNQEMVAKNVGFFGQIGIDVNKVMWFSNYLPYSIEQKEMDYIVIESEDDKSASRVIVIEFMKGKTDLDHISRSILYASWVRNMLVFGSMIVEPMLIANSSMDFFKPRYKKDKAAVEELSRLEKETKMHLHVYTYSFEQGVWNFDMKR